MVVRLSQRLVVSHHTEMPKLTDNIPMTGEQLNTKPRKVQFLLSGRPGGVIGRALEWRYKGCRWKGFRTLQEAAKASPII